MDMTILSSTKYSALQLHIRRSSLYIPAYSYEIEIATVKLTVVWNLIWHYSLSWVSIQIHFLIIENLFPFNYLFILLLLLFYYFFFVFNWIRLNKFRINMSVFFFFFYFTKCRMTFAEHNIRSHAAGLSNLFKFHFQL